MHQRPVAPASRLIPRAKYWQAHLSAQRISGLSQAEYCRRSHLGKSNFTAWKNRLKSPLPASAMELVPVSIIDRRQEVDESHSSSFSGLTIVAPCGQRIEVAENFRPATLKRLLLALGDSR